MIVKPSIGFNDVKFGMSELEVIAILGKPDITTTDEDDEDQNLVYQYNDLKVRLTFYSLENNRFSYFRTINPKATIDGSTIIGKPLSEVIENDKSDWEEELYFSFNAYFNEKKWITYHEEFGIITNIEMGLTFVGDTDEIEWPN